MRRFAAYLLLAAGTGLVLETGLTRADDDANQPVDGPAQRLEDGDAPGPGQGKRGERGERGRRRRGPGGPPGEGGRPEGGPGHHGPPPIIAALDADADGVISASEIEGAVSALKTLDKNEDGELTMEELHPKRPGRGGPPLGDFGPPGDGGPGDRGPGGRRGGRRGRGDREGRGGPPSTEQFIEKAMESDTDGDGNISKDEAPERMLRGFDRIDADGNGLIEKSELEEAAKRIGQRRGRGRRGEGRPGEEGPGGKRKRDRQPAPDESEV
jgi:hypothetical protein